MTAPRIKSDLAILDVKDGRNTLHKRLMAGEQFEVTLTGIISRHWGDDDGTSREFEVNITSAKLRPAIREAQRLSDQT